PAVSVVVVVQGESELLEVVLALGPGGGLPHLLHRGQEQADEDRNDRDHHQQLDQREPGTRTSHGTLPTPCGVRPAVTGYRNRTCSARRPSPRRPAWFGCCTPWGSAP